MNRPYSGISKGSLESVNRNCHGNGHLIIDFPSIFSPNTVIPFSKFTERSLFTRAV